MKVQVILNPYANRWKAKARQQEVEAALAAAGVDYELCLIPAPGEGSRLAAEAAQAGFGAVVAAGGDGTVNEVVNGLIRAAGDGPTLPLGVFPMGTGNDFNDMAGLPRTLPASAQVIAAGKTRLVDAGQVNNHYFDNNCALAMEPLVTLENIKMTRLSGNVRYVVALARALIHLKAWQMRITWDGGGYQGPTYLLSVCNSPRTGGLFPMAPRALMDDGLFDFVFAPEVSKLTVLAILAGLFRGKHINHPAVIYGRTASLEIESEPGTPIHADGELIATEERHVSYRILPAKITLLVP